MSDESLPKPPSEEGCEYVERLRHNVLHPFPSERLWEVSVYRFSSHPFICSITSNPVTSIFVGVTLT